MAVGLTGDPIHSGSWFGLPDIGLTEMFSPNRTAQGGSNIAGGGTTQRTTGGTNPYTGGQNTSTGLSSAGQDFGQRLRASTSIYSTTQTQQPTQQTQQISGGSGGGGGSISDAQYDALGVARGDIGGYNRVLAEQGRNQVDQGQQIRNEINQGFDAYISGLDNMLGNLPGQRKGQEQIVQNSYNQGVSDLTAQKTSSQADLDTQRRKTQEGQVKTLADIADNIRNLFHTGNVMLGTRGAGDSSAANQYSYAVTKLGSKQRGDVLAQTRSIEADIQDRESKLNNIFTQETSKLKTERDNNILQIAQYFQDKQNELIQAKAQGNLQRGQSLAQLSTQLLNQAQQYLMQADADYKNKQNALLTWATNNATTIGQLKSNLAAVGQYNAPGIQAQSINGAPTFDAQGNLNTMWSTGNSDEKLKNPFLR